MEVQDSDGNVTKINSLVFVETTTNGVYKAKYKKSDGTLVEIPIEASKSVGLRIINQTTYHMALIYFK